jgi:hypothetical protein
MSTGKLGWWNGFDFILLFGKDLQDYFYSFSLPGWK